MCENDKRKTKAMRGSRKTYTNQLTSTFSFTKCNIEVTEVMSACAKQAVCPTKRRLISPKAAMTMDKRLLLCSNFARRY